MLYPFLIGLILHHYKLYIMSSSLACIPTLREALTFAYAEELREVSQVHKILIPHLLLES